MCVACQGGAGLTFHWVNITKNSLHKSYFSTLRNTLCRWLAIICIILEKNENNIKMWSWIMEKQTDVVKNSFPFMQSGHVQWKLYSYSSSLCPAHVSLNYWCQHWRKGCFQKHALIKLIYWDFHHTSESLKGSMDYTVINWLSEDNCSLLL